jgi:hypothetical protein
MAKKLSPKEAAEVQWQKNTAHRYPWNDWANGETWVLVRGEDYKISTMQFRSQMSQVARRRGLTLHTIVSEDSETVTVKFEKPNDNDVTQNGTK